MERIPEGEIFIFHIANYLTNQEMKEKKGYIKLYVTTKSKKKIPL